jgi:hypothetical protein
LSSRAERLLSTFNYDLSANARKPIARHLDFPLKPGRKQAALVVEEAKFEIYKSFDEARCYLMANIDWIMKHYGDRHQIKREDIMIVSQLTLLPLMKDRWSVVSSALCDGCFRVLATYDPQVQRTHRIGSRTWRAMGYLEFCQGQWSRQPPSQLDADLFRCQFPCQSKGVVHGTSSPTRSR